ncbi:PAS domain-containing protein [Pedobacter metabolipauper]|uniref:histidine kinase n=1 Tax=Pedobacter metabolipauper TaxID=425513 RepID=A0A4R6SZ60_9SPHI|nr:PAS domain-containing protein [Pedobacter metabolipauper]TDQ11059.1 PAS domain S-box-containing protein [Pedobacter metabolipauper]
MLTNILEWSGFSSLVEASPMPTAIYEGPDMIIKIANQAMLDLWGKDASSIGKPLSVAVPELENQPFFGLLAEVLKTGVTYQAKEDRADLIVNGKIQTFYFTFTYKAIKDAEGKTVAIFNTAADVTELVNTRKQIIETKDRLSFALQSAEVGTWDLDPINNHVVWDNRCKELFGFSGDTEVLYADVLNCIHPEDEDRVQQAVAKAIDPAKTGAYDIRYRTVDRNHQQIRWVHCKGKAYFNKDNVAYRFAGTAVDITAEVSGRRREQQLLSLVDHNIDHMSIADMDGNLIYMNNAARRMLGVDQNADIAQYSAIDFYTPKELARVQGEIIHAISHQSGWQGVISLKNRLTDDHIPCQVNYILIKDPVSGEVIGRGATARDLRPELKAKADLQRLATIVEISEDFCNYCDIQGNTIYLNRAGSKLIGLYNDDVHTKTLYDYHTTSSNQLINEVVLDELKRSGKWSGRLELIHQETGEIIPIHKQMFMIYEEITNEPVAIAGIARDLRPEIAARRLIDEKNAELNNLVKELNFLADSQPAVVWTSTPDGNLDYINQRWSERGSIPVEEALGSGWTTTMHPDDVPVTVKTWEYSLESGDPYQAEFRLKDKDGNYRWWLVRALPLKDEDGNVIKWYGSNMDISDQKELEKQKDNFLAVASHELKTPVTSIKAYAQVMETLFRRSGDTRNADLVGKMDKQVNRLNSLIGDLLDVTKINSGRMQFNHTTFDFNELVEEISETIQLTTQKHIIHRELKYNRPITGDKERIGQVIVNLLSNAVKYSPDANRIVVYTEDQGSNVQLCVQDFGIGISKEKQDKVFEQFYRVSGTREHTFPGLGLGLYISSEIVKRMGGEISVKSVKGKGSTFCFTLPIE